MKTPLFINFFIGAKRENIEDNQYLYLLQSLNNQVRVSSSFNLIKDTCFAQRTDIMLEPYGVTFGASIKETKKFLGKPNDEITQIVKGNYVILTYNHIFEDLDYVSHFHFFENRLVYVSSDFEYKNIGEDFNKEIFKAIAEKYNFQLDYCFDDEVAFVDSYKNQIRIVDNGVMKIQYYAGDKVLLNGLSDLKNCFDNQNNALLN